ncbi:tRNA pseudouridine(13) synthase TruD [Thermovibrio ammonificans]|jgi:tRNA pseudouridine13 synthase|uniref:tRNA pseudouridine synthase D n=1 Tax=Thermovibrio ammonificans (strain DSM 15698 / JCM 12110 / HB-1) TaxID=648996 RepID=E8T4Z8_THEA1|nr:tRNA pseudouridine(13) synthase TruD [Thermovibrio ammonificans]ADU97530.1 tRNA pseudouridine synthase D TruD [Thermovibrio ammonificans HB-1]
MKLYSRIKTRPEDFVVEELPTLKPGNEGKFWLLKLKKRNTSTLEALRVISRFKKIPLKKIGFAGLKDRFAVTVQYLTVPVEFEVGNWCFEFRNGRWVEVEAFDFTGMGFCVEPLGRVNRPLTLGDLKGNRFTVVIRNFEKNLRERFYRNYEVVKRYGFPNYFGEQRFGSVKSRDDFVLRYLLRGDFDGALRSYFFGKSSIDFWGDWRKLYKTLSPTLEEYEKDLIRGLMRGLTAEKAFRILPKNVRLMFNFAYQSFLWNEVLREYVEAKYPFVRVPFINNWKLSYYLEVHDIDYLKELQIPYTGKEYPPEDPVLKKAMSRVFRRYGVKEEWFDAQVGGMAVMTDGLRRAVVFPEGFKVLEKTKRSVKLTFTLPSGSYATILLRFLLKV